MSHLIIRKLSQQISLYSVASSRGTCAHCCHAMARGGRLTTLQLRKFSSYGGLKQYIQKLCSAFSSTNANQSPKVSWHGHTKPAEVFDQDWIPLRTDCHISTSNMKEQVDFGILFDIDGVIGRGAKPLAAAQRMIKLLTDKDGKQIVPLAFCTNSTGAAADKAKTLTKWLDIEIKPDQMIPAQGPLSAFRKFHDKRTLVVGQGKLHVIAEEMGFTNIVTIDEVKKAFPLLDIVDHSNRTWIAKNGITRSHSQDDFEPIEAMVLIGEPNRWETHLQLLVDLLLTGGHPSFNPEGGFPKQHIPVLACNMDLVFMAEACMPRFGHGAFLVCLESLFKKITGQDLQYTALIGKPSEITFRYSEHCLAEKAAQIGIDKPLKTMYIVGDNPEVDIYGANLYNEYIHDCMKNETAGKAHSSRQVPTDYEFRQQTATKCSSVLVGTGVYDPKIGKIEDQEMEVYHHGHRDFEVDKKLRVPSYYCSDVYEAVLTILEAELGADKINNNDNMKELERSEV